MVARVGLLAFAALLALAVHSPSWLYVVAGGGMIVTAGTLGLLLIDPTLRNEFLSWVHQVNPLGVSRMDQR
jgi:hypothetical protein